jgi:acyl-CoA thioester hydrolase
MGFSRHYFPSRLGAPPPLTATVSRRVRFEEVDLLGIVWHGRYASFIEDGRIAFGDRYGLSYQQFIQHAVAAPIVQMHLDYQAPLRFDETMDIEINLHWNEALRLDFSYRIRGPAGRAVARGYTVQLLTDPEGNLLLIPPAWIQEFRHEWRQGRLG